MIKCFYNYILERKKIVHVSLTSVQVYMYFLLLIVLNVFTFHFYFTLIIFMERNSILSYKKTACKYHIFYQSTEAVHSIWTFQGFFVLSIIIDVVIISVKVCEYMVCVCWGVSVQVLNCLVFLTRKYSSSIYIIRSLHRCHLWTFIFLSSSLKPLG